MLKIIKNTISSLLDKNTNNKKLLQSGDYFDYLNPEIHFYKIEDIAHSLSLICRFNGHTKEFYSVAQHSYLASYLVPEEYAFEALNHDNSEAYLGDVATPLKSLLPDYRLLEKQVEKAIAKQFNLHWPLPECVKQADLIMLATECRDLLSEPNLYGINGQLLDAWKVLKDVSPNRIKIEPWSSEFARSAFLRRFNELDQRRSKITF